MENLEHTFAMYESFYAARAPKASFRMDRPDPFSRPYSAISYGRIEDQGKSRLAVLKTYRQLTGISVGKVAQRTYREVKLLVALRDAPVPSPNINQFHGIFYADSTLVREALPGIPSIVVDFIEYDSLQYTRGKEFSVRLNIVQQLGNGLQYMHSLDLVHGDLKPDNFRVTKDGVVKIIDFGLGRYQTTEHTGFTTIVSPSYRFIAPELIIPDVDDVSMFVTKASDVYAYSMTALQVLDGREFRQSIPFNQYGDCIPYAIRHAIVSQEWPQLQHYSGVTPEAWGVISACWTVDATGRPTIDGLLKSLSGIPLPV